MPNYTFFPWVRPDLKHLPADSRTTDVPVSAHVLIELVVNDNPPVKIDAALDGPADVLGLDRRQITRMEPAPGTLTFEPNYLAAIEFARPDLPWLFTPAVADAQGRLRPWIVLVVIRKQHGVELSSVPQQLSRLEIKTPVRPADELPDLENSWAWAHAQLDDKPLPGETVQSIIATTPHRLGSRLWCPRRLKPNTNYIAALVPAFAAGRLAGLGQANDAIKTLTPAWTAQDASVLLPLYHHWEFSTGEGGDFESLLKLLLHPPTPVDATRPPGRLIDAGGAGEGLPTATGDRATFTLECPLVPLDKARIFDETFARRFATALRPLLLPAREGADPRVTPPVYGLQHAGLKELPLDTEPPRWLRELNLDPRFRVAAAFGAEVVRRNQQRFVDEAWDQAGDIKEANKLLRHAQAAVAAGSAILRRHFEPLSSSELFDITRSLHRQIAFDGTQSFQAMLAEAGAPKTMFAAEFQRAARPRGPVLRRTAPAGRRVALPLLEGFSLGRIASILIRRTVAIATPEVVEARFKAAGGAHPPNATPVAYVQIGALGTDVIPPRFVVAAPALPTGVLVGVFLPFRERSAHDTETATRFRDAFKAHQPLLKQKGVVIPAPRTPLDLKSTGNLLLAKLAPKVQFASVVSSMVIVTESAASPPPSEPPVNLDQLRTSPKLEEPLYAALGAISPDLVVQGFENIAPNTITPLATNTAFVEAFLAGANHEMARELVWREFPVDERATVFEHFWDSHGRSEGAQADIPPMDQWKPNEPLGRNATGGALAVFLIRGELVRRYPTAIVHLVDAIWPAGQARPTLGQQELQPMVRGTLAADAAFYGFAIDPAALTAKPGWFFVVQEPPAEPRFGLEVEAGDTPIALKADAAITAKALLQRPVRIAIHASDLLSPHG